MNLVNDIVKRDQRHEFYVGVSIACEEHESPARIKGN